jgi:hypothetical protein
MANIFTRYFRGRGVQNTKDNENMAPPPDDTLLTDGPYRGQQVTEPPKPKTRLAFYEREAGSIKGVLEALIAAFSVIWLIALAFLFCLRAPFMGTVWFLNRPLIVILVMCLFWCIGYLRVKRVPVEE